MVDQRVWMDATFYGLRSGVDCASSGAHAKLRDAGKASSRQTRDAYSRREDLLFLDIYDRDSEHVVSHVAQLFSRG